jgi:type I restriction enzyme M protein
VCWLLTKNKRQRGLNRNRTGELLVMDAGDMGEIKDRVLRELSEEELKKIAGVFHNWKRGSSYQDEAGFCKSLQIEQIIEKDYSLIPGLYVGMPPKTTIHPPFSQEMSCLSTELAKQTVLSRSLDDVLTQELTKFGFIVDDASIYKL